MTVTKRADMIVDNWINGNRSDALDMMTDESLPIEELMIVAIIIGRDTNRVDTNGMISSLFSRMGVS